MNKKIAIGIDNFKELIDEQNYYVDKTLFIKEIIDLGSKVTLITRPRRFGKTLNMSMLKYFFEKTEEDNSYLFDDLLITKQESDEYIYEQSKYSVIFITLKKAKSNTWEKTYEMLKEIISNEFKNFLYLLENDTLSELEKEEFMSVINKTGNEIRFINSLIDLTTYLKRYHKEDCIILIDEYDTPLQNGYLEGYFDNVLSFMKGFLGASLKGNKSLKRGVLTGIMKIAKESIFSDFNNPTIATLISNYSKDKFGFTEEEVNNMLEYYNLENKFDELKKWYNGYIFGNDQVIYNPWSILNYVNIPDDGFKPYWVNTGSRDLIKRVLQLEKTESKKTIEALLENKKVTKELTEHIVYQDIDRTSDVLWSFLLHSGYLKIVNKEQNEDEIKYDLAIPNTEIRIIYKNILKNYFEEDIEISSQISGLITTLLVGEIDKFSRVLKTIYLSHVSYYDLSMLDRFKDVDEIEQDIRYENFHHGFILGLLMYAADSYEIYSNREYGLGRPDIVLIPKDKNKTSYIFEFKWSSTQDKKTLENILETAKTQIVEKKYIEGVKAVHKVENIVTIAVGFKGKELEIELDSSL